MADRCDAPGCTSDAAALLSVRHPAVSALLDGYVDRDGQLRIRLCGTHADAFGDAPRLTLPDGTRVPFRVWGSW